MRAVRCREEMDDSSTAELTGDFFELQFLVVTMKPDVAANYLASKMPRAAGIDIGNLAGQLKLGECGLLGMCGVEAVVTDCHKLSLRSMRASSHKISLVHNKLA